MNDTKRGIALKLRVNDYSYGVKVVYLVKTLILVIHLFVDAVDRFYSSLKREMNMVFRKLLGDDRAYTLYHVKALTVFTLDRFLDLTVSYRVKVLYTDVFKLLLDLLNSKSMRQASVRIL